VAQKPSLQLAAGMLAAVASGGARLGFAQRGFCGLERQAAVVRSAAHPGLHHHTAHAAQRDQCHHHQQHQADHH
jgi:hypothetical protein